MKFKHKKKFNLRASMALSMNAIVVIILAMAMLGVGIFIVNKIRGEVVPVLDIEAPPLKSPADSSIPIVLEREEISLESGKSGKFKVSIYNDKTNISAIELSVEGDCYPVSKTFNATNTLLDPIGGGGKTIPGRKQATFWVLVVPSDSDLTTVCTLKAEHVTSGDLIGTVDAVFDIR